MGVANWAPLSPTSSLSLGDVWSQNEMSPSQSKHDFRASFESTAQLNALSPQMLFSAGWYYLPGSEETGSVKPLAPTLAGTRSQL